MIFSIFVETHMEVEFEIVKFTLAKVVVITNGGAL